MSIVLDHQLREQIPQEILDFPVAFYSNELADLPDRAGPVHWHPYCEIATAERSVLDCQVGQTHLQLQPGDSIFINRNMLHAIRQLSGGAPDGLPILVFAGNAVAPEGSAVYRKYIQPILDCATLPFVVFRRDSDQWQEVRARIRAACTAMRQRPDCYELAVQRCLSCVLEALYRQLDTLPAVEASRVQLNTQIRLQKMLSFLYEQYAGPVTLADIAAAAHISRSEAGRCFQAYLGCSPVEALIRYRLQRAWQMLQETDLTLQQISDACGFHSVNYFRRQFRRRYGCAPGEKQKMGK